MWYYLIPVLGLCKPPPIPFRHGEAQIHHCSWSSLVQVMARRFFMLAKPLAKPVLIYIINWILRSMKFKSKCKRFIQPNAFENVCKGNINIYLHLIPLLHIDITQVLKILPQVKPGSTYSTWSIS